MKKIMTFLSLLITVMVQSQVYTTNNWGTNNLDKYNVTATSASYVNTLSNNVNSAALALTKDNIFYYSPVGGNGSIGDGGGIHEIRSIKPDGTDISLGKFDINGSSTANLEGKRMGARSDGRVFLMFTETNTDKMYVASFMSNNNGGLSDFKVHGIGNLNYIGNNGDICFDNSNNVYLLTNSDNNQQTKLAVIPQSIYESSTFNVIYRFNILDKDGNNFSDPVTGCAFIDEAGNFAFGGQNGNTSGIYVMNFNTLNNSSGTVRVNKLLERPYLADMASNFFPRQTALPVVFGEIKAEKNNTGLNVKWVIESEKNNKEYVIQVSKDGKEFKDIKTIKSKGDSTTRTEYSEHIPYGVLGMISLAFILFLPFKNRSLKICLIMLLGLLLVVSCSKEDKLVNDTEAKFLRIKQIDKNNIESYSKIIKIFIK